MQNPEGGNRMKKLDFTFCFLLLLSVLFSGCTKKTTDSNHSEDAAYESSVVKNLYEGEDHIQAVLYFADSDMDCLKAEEREISISLTDSFPLCLVNALISGPSEEGLRRILPESGTVLSAQIRDGICYLDLAEDCFDTYIGTDLQEKLVVFSIVNTITQLPAVDKVQILKNGVKCKYYYASVRIDEPLGAESELIQ